MPTKHRRPRFGREQGACSCAAFICITAVARMCEQHACGDYWSLGRYDSDHEVAKSPNICCRPEDVSGRCCLSGYMKMGKKSESSAESDLRKMTQETRMRPKVGIADPQVPQRHIIAMSSSVEWPRESTGPIRE